MNVLALDTSSVACSAALASDGGETSRHELRPREHTRLLLPMIHELLAAAELDVADLDAVVLGNGPGSFIGMRISASVAQGLCFGSGARLVPVSSLAAIAAEAIAEHAVNKVLVAQDARMQEVYLARFERDEQGVPRAVGVATLHAAGVIAGLPDGYTAAGGGWERYPALWEANRRRLEARLPVYYPRASHLLALGARALAAGGAVDPERLEPAYVRDEVAKPADARMP